MSDDLQQAVTAIKSGDKTTGKRLLIEVLKANQHNEIAWLWMTQVVNNDEERIKYLQNVLKINPGNEKAKRGLVKLQQNKKSRSKQINKVNKKSNIKSLKPPASAPQSTTNMTKQCPYCAETIKVEAKVCRFCSRDLTGQQPQSIQAQPSIIVQSSPQRLWSPGIAAILSLVIPGTGQMYKGQIGKGLFHLLVVVIGYVLFIVPGLILHILCIIDATRGNPYQGTGKGQQIRSAKKKVEDSPKGSKLPLVILLGIPAGLVGFCVLILLVIFSVRTPPIENESLKQAPTTVTPLEIKTAKGEVLVVPGKAFIDGRDVDAKPALTIMQVNIWEKVPRVKVVCKLEHGSEIQLLEAQEYTPESRYYFLLQSESCKGWLSENFLSVVKQDPVGDKM